MRKVDPFEIHGDFRKNRHNISWVPLYFTWMEGISWECSISTHGNHRKMQQDPGYSIPFPYKIQYQPHMDNMMKTG